MSESFPAGPGGPSGPGGPQQQPGPAGGGAAVLDRQELPQEIEPGDHERFSHYVKKEKILESALSGEAVKALCGKMWVPSRDPQRFPVCPRCKAVYDGMQPGDDDAGGDSGADS